MLYITFLQQKLGLTPHIGFWVGHWDKEDAKVVFVSDTWCLPTKRFRNFWSISEIEIAGIHISAISISRILTKTYLCFVRDFLG